MKNKPSQIVSEWLKRADSDFGFARAAFEDFDDFYSQMCILCHDAAEKYLKAYMVAQKGKYKRIHDLVTLLKDCGKILNEDLSDLEKGCRILNNYYAPLKYPSHFSFVTKKQAAEALKITEEINKFIKGKLSE
ncbi:MAG: HEPN domain-containing protein [Candidatus Saganbacteria bacterium]|uniref:HEPN domain-containing protein n=1 Tax=Candidatus Saganbacteria bacterium TaxID=2575572 RepID=A0A833L172_UNCSA|nr:MAG: HEPN domain-containing protein [Candidatus Saganbacteria bacterium]